MPDHPRVAAHSGEFRGSCPPRKPVRLYRRATIRDGDGADHSAAMARAGARPTSAASHSCDRPPRNGFAHPARRKAELAQRPGERHRRARDRFAAPYSPDDPDGRVQHQRQALRPVGLAGKFVRHDEPRAFPNLVRGEFLDDDAQRDQDLPTARRAACRYAVPGRWSASSRGPRRPPSYRAGRARSGPQGLSYWSISTSSSCGMFQPSLSTKKRSDPKVLTEGVSLQVLAEKIEGGVVHDPLPDWRVQLSPCAVIC